MLFFLNPITSLVNSLSQEKALAKAYLGLSETMTKPITNSVGEFRFYYSRFLGYIIHNLESTIAEIEAKTIELRSAVALAEPSGSYIATTPTEEVKALPMPEVELSHPEPKSEALVVEQAQTSSTPQNLEIVEASETEDDSDWPIPEKPEPTTSLKDRMLTCKCQQQLKAFKAEIGTQKVTELWEKLDILERNHIKSIDLSPNPTKAPATTGYLFQYTDGEKNKHKAQLIGHYLYGEPLKDSERSILIIGKLKPIVVRKSALRPYTAKDQKPLFSGELEQLQHFLTKSQTQDDDEPTAQTVAANTSTGVAPSPKLNSGSETGSKPDSQLLKPNAGVQIELNLQTPDNQELPPTPTPALEVIASELKRFHPQNTLTFTYLTTPRSTFLTIKHSDSEVGCFEDDGSDIYEVGNKNLTFHGFTQEQVSKAYDAGEAVLESLKQKKA